MGRRLKFRGGETHKVDGKGRVSIPKEYRRVIEAGDPDWVAGKTPSFVIHYGDVARRKCLKCYTVAAFEEVEDQIEALPRGSQRRTFLEHFFSSNAATMTLDPGGRIVLPAPRRRMIDVGEEAQFIATGDTFEIWNPAHFETQAKAATDAVLARLPEDVDPLALLDPDMEF